MHERLQEQIEERTDKLVVEYAAKQQLQELLHPAKPLAFRELRTALEEETITERWVVDQILPQGALTLCVAQHKTGKTTGMMNLASRLLKGKPFLGYTADTYDRGILYLNADMPERLFLWYAKNFDWPADRMHLITVSAGEFNVESEAQMEALTADCLARDIGIVIIDVWGSVFLGDENDNSEVRHAVNKLSQFRTDANLDALIVLHHSGWGEAGRSRGASSFEGAVDVIWRLKAHSSGPNSFQASGRITPTPKVGVRFDERTWQWSACSMD